MTVTSRWVRYPVAGTTELSAALEGERGIARGTDVVSDTFSIGTSTSQIRVNLDGIGAQQITLTSGTSLDPRFVAKDITRKLQALSSLGNAYRYAQAEFSNYESGDGSSHFVIRSGTTGAGSSVAITSGDNDGSSTLGLSTVTAVVGTTYHTGTTTSNDAGYTGTVTVTGTYGGMLDDEYQVIIADDLHLAISPDGGNTYAGTAETGGDWNHDTACTYTVTIDTTNGAVMNAGTGNVPTFTVSDAGGLSDDVVTPQELLFSDTWYYVGSNGAMIKFTDSQFGDGDSFVITCTPITDCGDGTSSASVGSAKYIFTSRGGENASASASTSTTAVNIGNKGVTMAWSDNGVLTAKDSWRVLCVSPTPEAYGVTNINYGNVTVTTNSPVKVHQFEIMSGATQMDNVKFSLYSHGTFSHHDSGDADTEFHFGTVGAGNRGDHGGIADNGVEWKSSVSASDISTDKTGGNTGSPVFLWSAVDDLAEVTTADNAEDVGNVGLVGDFVYTAIKLGANETGANSGIVYRLYFDYS